MSAKRNTYQCTQCGGACEAIDGGSAFPKDCIVCGGYNWRLLVPHFDKEADTQAATPASISSAPPGPGRKFDSGKLRFGLIPTQTLTSLAKVLTYGAKKYDANNWQNVERFRERYLDALYRHLEAWRSGEEVDPESGLLHLEHVLCNAAFLCWDAVVRGPKNK